LQYGYLWLAADGRYLLFYTSANAGRKRKQRQNAEKRRHL